MRTFLLCLALSGMPALAFAQERAHVQPAARADLLRDGVATRVQGALGVEIPAGIYVRVGMYAGAGSSTAANRGLDARADVIARFLLDPFRQRPWALSAGGGLSLRADHGSVARPFLVAVVDLEGPRMWAGFSPSVQAGLGGGVRVGIGFRRSTASLR